MGRISGDPFAPSFFLIIETMRLYLDFESDSFINTFGAVAVVEGTPVQSNCLNPLNLIGDWFGTPSGLGEIAAFLLKEHRFHEAFKRCPFGDFFRVP